ncbi:MAG: hypothetical protein ACJAUY_000675 [Cognaticolwellia sp.]|jgi:hypothetical protein
MGIFSKIWKKVTGWLVPDVPKQEKGFNLEKVGTNQSIPVIYGKYAKAPVIKVLKMSSDVSGGAKNEYLHFICIVCEGEIGAFGEVFFDGIAASAIDSERYHIEKYTGSDTQTHSADLTSHLSLWKATADLNGLAYLYVRLHQNKNVDWWSREPIITVDVDQGKKVHDLRDGQTKYSNSLALCTYDFLLNTRYGKGLSASEVNAQAMMSEADYNELQRTYSRTVYVREWDPESRTWITTGQTVENETVTENLFSCNVMLDTDKTIKENVEILLKGARAALTESGGKYTYIIEKEKDVAYAFTTDDLAGGITSEGSGQNNRFNQVIIKYRSRLTGEMDEVVYPESDTLHQTWLAEDNGKLLLGEFTIETIDNKAEAIQMGHVITQRSRQDLRAQWIGFPWTIQWEAGDVISLPSKINGWIAKPFLIESAEPDLDTGLVKFQGVEHQNTIYPWSVTETTEEYTDTSFFLPNDIPSPTGLVFQKINNDLLKQGKLVWDDANNAAVTFYRVIVLNAEQNIVKSEDLTENFFDVYGLEGGQHTFKLYAGNSLFLSQNTNITVTLEKTTVGWDVITGKEALFLDPRISNAEITGFVTEDLYAQEKAVLQSQIDKAITTWFYDGAPTLANSPASDWATGDDKNTHLGDLYYDNNTGYAYRFLINGTTYEWQKVSDSDVTLALANAAKAQDTADGKRRVFVAQPVTPYDVGDLWDTGSGIKRCQTDRTTSENYNGADWLLVSDVTDYGQSVSRETFSFNAHYTSAVILLIPYANGATGWGESEVFGTLTFRRGGASGTNRSERIDIAAKTAYNTTYTALSKSDVSWNWQVVKVVYNGLEWLALKSGNNVQDARWEFWGQRTLSSTSPAGNYSPTDQFKFIAYDSTTNGTLNAEIKNSITPVNVSTLRDAAGISLINATEAQSKADAAADVAIAAADAAAKADAELARVTAEAYADNIVTAEEARAIADAQAKADAAQSAAIAAAEIDAQARADAAKAEAILAADIAAKADAELARVTAEAYADNIVTAEEARAIADAQAKADAAQLAAQQYSEFTQSNQTLFNINGIAPDVMPAGSPFAIGFSRTTMLNYDSLSDFIPVKKGETLHWEMWAKQTGNTAKAYMGIERFDRNKKPLGSNNGTVYGGLINTVVSNTWTKYVYSHTLPETHTPYNGSDGQEVCYVRVRLLMNYNTTGQAYYSGYRLYRVQDQQFMPNLVSAGAGTALNVNPLSAIDNGSTAKINIASHTRQYGFGLLTLNAGSISGLAFSTKYYVYYDDPTYTGGTVTYNATTNLQTIAAGNHRIFVSSITTPANGGGSTTPPVYDCITLDMWLTPDLQGKDLQTQKALANNEIDLWFQGENAVKGQIKQSRLIEQKQVIYEIQTSSGAIVRISESTPLELENHVIITPKELTVNVDELATLKGDSNQLVWEKVTRAEIIGEQPVMHISVGNGSFAAGVNAKNRIITHNGQQKP